MSNNNNNKKSPVVSIIIVSVVVLGLGYFLFKSSPDNSQAKQNITNNINNFSFFKSWQHYNQRHSERQEQIYLYAYPRGR